LDYSLKKARTLLVPMKAKRAPARLAFKVYGKCGLWILRICRAVSQKRAEEMSDTNMPAKEQPSTLTIYRDANGSCSVRNQDGSRGGFFVSYEAAQRFVKNETARYRPTDMA
jgi:hypothetical protein